MNRMSIGGVLIFLAGILWVVRAQEAITGQWMIDRTPAADQVQLTLHRSARGGSHTNSSGFPAGQLKGLTRAQMDSPDGSTVHFQIVRDAGSLQCEGYFKKGNGAGAFTFAPDPNFVSEMRALGYPHLSPEQVFSMAIQNVSLDYVRALKSLGVANAAADDLITMRIHDVTIEYVKDLQSLGYGKLKPDQLVTFRIHGVETCFIRELNQLGYRSVSPDELVTMRIHDATTDFIKALKTLGYEHPSIDQLVTMRIHDVTPEYIQKLRGQGIKRLSIDQLVSLRIHGIAD